MSSDTIGLTDAEAADLQFDRQLFYLAGAALFTILGIIIYLFVGFRDLSTAQSTIQRQINSGIIDIRLQILNPTFYAARALVTNIGSVLEIAATNVLSIITRGVTSCINVLVSIGKRILNALLNCLEYLLDVLGDVGSEIINFFINNIAPKIPDIISTLDEVVLKLYLITAMIAPFLYTIQSLFNAFSGGEYPAPPLPVLPNILPIPLIPAPPTE
jgi:hypothetical protein